MEMLRRLQSWGLQMELVDELEMGLTLFQASPASSSALRSDPEARSAAFSVLVDSMLLTRSSSEELDVMGVEVGEILCESVSSLTPTYWS